MLLTKSIAEFRAAQKQGPLISDKVLLTLAGLKILNDHCAEDRKCWKLVAIKARNALKNMLGFTSNIDQALTDLSLTFVF